MKAEKNRRTGEMDHLIARNIRKAREAAGITQKGLAQALVPMRTFQQVQKYESGTNRVSAATLWQISRLTGWVVEDFFK